MREVLTFPNDILLQKSEPVKDITPEIKALADDLMEQLSVNHNGIICVSISAPQVGELVRMFVFRPNPFSIVPDVKVVINPVITYTKKTVILKETCLSIPGRSFAVRRFKAVKLRGLNIYGKYCSFKETGLIAQMFQHEINHLDGVLINSIGEEVDKYGNRIQRQNIQHDEPGDSNQGT